MPEQFVSRRTVAADRRFSPFGTHFAFNLDIPPRARTTSINRHKAMPISTAQQWKNGQ
jgi:hypothetical protein